MIPSSVLTGEKGLKGISFVGDASERGTLRVSNRASKVLRASCDDQRTTRKRKRKGRKKGENNGEYGRASSGSTVSSGACNVRTNCEIILPRTCEKR
jgi:hypothetical protein